MITDKWYILPYEELEDSLENTTYSPKYTDNSSVINFSSFPLNGLVNCLVYLVCDSEYHNQLSNIRDVYILGSEELVEIFNSKFNTNLYYSQITEMFQHLLMNAGD